MKATFHILTSGTFPTEHLYRRGNISPAHFSHPCNQRVSAQRLAASKEQSLSKKLKVPSPLMVSLVERRRRALSGRPQCPGEETCEIWESAAQPKFEMACLGCEHLATKPPALAREAAHILRGIDDLAAQRGSGHAPDLRVLRPMQWELLKLRDLTEAQVTHEERGESHQQQKLLLHYFKAFLEAS
jgi:hypothetical protein